MPNAYLIRSDARAIPIRDESIDCVVTSPPYWGLRDYGVAGQLGLESSPQEYVAGLVAVFAECWRVLRPAGIAWLNLGDSYAQAGGPGWQGKNGQRADRRFTAVRDTAGMRDISRRPPADLKAKDLVGIPWRVAFALQAAGWWLRSDVVWAKPNPMPESVTDRPTRSHEYIFLLAKAERYWYDADAISEAFADERMGNPGGGGHYVKEAYTGAVAHDNPQSGLARGVWNEDGTHARRNARSVWTIATQPYSGAHFATFPQELARRCILAGCPAGGTVLDPFAGSGTVGRVAIENGRDAVLCDLRYQDLADRRTTNINMPLPFAGIS